MLRWNPKQEHFPILARTRPSSDYDIAAEYIRGIYEGHVPAITSELIFRHDS